MIPKNLIDRGQYWTDSLTLVSGCSPVSKGCEHCWSAGMASRFYWGKEFAENGKWTGKVDPNQKALEKLEKREGSERKLKPRVFCIWNDFLHPQIPPDFQLRALHAMHYLEHDIFLILTKRPENIEDSAFCQGPFEDTDLSNVYLGVSVESQKHIHRIDQLIQNWPGKKFVSIEPCLGAVDLSSDYIEHLNGVILGGESGPKARPMHPEWARSIRDQCVDAGVPFFFKQWGEHKILVSICGEGTYKRVGKKQAGRLLDGRVWDQLVWNEKGDQG